MASVATGVRAEVHILRDIDPDDPLNMYHLLAFEWTQVAPQSFCLNDFASRNISSMLNTLDTSHFERSPLNDVVEANMRAMAVRLDTSHFEIPPLDTVAKVNMPTMWVALDMCYFERSP